MEDKQRTMINTSKNLRIMTNSLTETEIASTSESYPKSAWFIYFRIAQGDYESKEDVLLRDEESCMFLHRSYPLSSRKGTKYAHLRYFVVVGKIDKKEVKITCYPTD